MAEGATHRSFMDTVGGLITIVGAVAALTAYCVSLQFTLNEANREIERLSKQVDTISARTASNAQGPKGDRGETGPQGPRGEKGEQGIQGQPGAVGGGGGVDEVRLGAMIDDRLSQKLASMPKAVAANTDVSGLFDMSKCTPASEIKKRDTLIIFKGMEVCDASGALLTRMNGLADSNRMVFWSPGTGDWSCSSSSKCRFDWDPNRDFYYERSTEKDGKSFTSIRFASRD
ncbi:hypothetical protein [Rhizobium leguminosarum]|uniref:hypothetical protein n=1 Tax=Rhizobium leguminosarum TaxID=384 RepID=UPI003F97E786